MMVETNNRIFILKVLNVKGQNINPKKFAPVFNLA